MSDIDRYLRYMINGDKEYKVTTVSMTGPTTQRVPSALVMENTRRRLAIYNQSNAASGEAYYSFSGELGVSGEVRTNWNMMPIPSGMFVEIPVADVTGLDLWVGCNAGNYILKIEEIA